jgi:hypothetical protein
MKNKTLKKENRFLKKQLKKTKGYKKLLDYEMDIMGCYRIKEKEFFKIHYLLSNNYDDFTNNYVKDIYKLISSKKGLTERQIKLLLKIIQKEIPLYILNS